MIKNCCHINHIRQFVLVLLLSVISISMYGQVRFYATADANKVFQGSYFKVVFTVENSNMKNFIPPDFKGFRIISGPNEARFNFYINGITGYKYSYSYTLLAEKRVLFS